LLTGRSTDKTITLSCSYSVSHQFKDRVAMTTTSRPFVRSRTDRMLAGVMGGIAQRFGWNANLVRIIFVIVSIASAAVPGLLIYLILWLLMPEEG